MECDCCEQDSYEVRFERVRDLVIALEEYKEQFSFSIDEDLKEDIYDNFMFAWNEMLKELEIERVTPQDY